MNIWDIVLLALVGLLLFTAVRSIIRRNTGCCSSGCEGCPCGCGKKKSRI